jgi:hypothetical protein
MKQKQKQKEISKYETFGKNKHNGFIFHHLIAG